MLNTEPMVQFTRACRPHQKLSLYSSIDGALSRQGKQARRRVDPNDHLSLFAVHQYTFALTAFSPECGTLGLWDQSNLKLGGEGLLGQPPIHHPPNFLSLGSGGGACPL